MPEKKKSSDANLGEESEKPMPCIPISSDGFYAERLPAPESNPTSGASLNIEMTYLHKAEENFEKYLEIVDDVIINKEKPPEEGQDKKPNRFIAEQLISRECSSALGATPNISIEMTYLHKQDEEKVDHKRREYRVLYKAPCTSSDMINERRPSLEISSALGVTSAAEDLMDTDDDEYDDVLIENEISSDTSPGGYEEPDVVNSERPPVTPPDGYEEIDVVNPERSPVPGRSHSRRVTSNPGETSFYQELR